MLFLVWIKLEKSDSTSQRQIYELWVRESKLAPDALKRESPHALESRMAYKIAGRQEIIAIFDFESPQVLDKALSQFPLLKETGHRIEIDVLPLYPIREFMQYAEKALQENLV